MAISTYAELKTSIANWLDREDLTDIIPDFIALAETRHKRDFKIRRMETRVTANMPAPLWAYAARARTVITSYDIPVSRRRPALR